MQIFRKPKKMGSNNHEIRIQRPKISGYSISHVPIRSKIEKVNFSENEFEKTSPSLHKIVISRMYFARQEWIGDYRYSFCLIEDS